MLSFTPEAIQEMESGDSCRVAFRLIINGVEHTQRVSSIGTVRSAIRPVTGESEIGVLSLTVLNDDGYFSYLNPSSPLYGQPYHKYITTLYLGVVLPNGLPTTQPVFSGYLSYIDVQADRGTAVLKVVDVFEILKATGPGALVGKTMNADGVSAYDECPAAMVRKIITSTALAGVVNTFYDLSSFLEPVYRERASRTIVRGFKFSDGSWYSNIRDLLDHSSAGLRVSASGRLQYFTLDPQLPSGAFHLRKGRNMVSMAHQQNRSDIKNSIGVRRSDGTDLVATAHSPLQDATSVTNFGLRPFSSSSDFPYLQDDDAAEISAARKLYAQSAPLTTFQVEAHYEAMQVEVGDFVLLTDPDQGLAAKSLLCYDRTINPDARRVSMSLVDYELTSGLWARMDSSHFMNSTRVWW